MSVEANKAVARQFLEAPLTSGNLAVLDELCAPTFIFHRYGNREELKAGIAYLRTGFPTSISR